MSNTPKNIKINDSQETRIALLEQSIGHISQTLLRIESRIDKLDGRIDQLDANQKNDFRWLLSIMIVFGASLLGAMAKGFHWI